MAPTMNISYDQAPYDVRQDIAHTHCNTWDHIAAPGTWLSGERRVAIPAMPPAVRCVRNGKRPCRPMRSRETTTIWVICRMPSLR